MSAFAQDYDVVAIDMRGYNTSDKPKVCRGAVCWTAVWESGLHSLQCWCRRCSQWRVAGSATGYSL
jgi:pimeloyl-ACP methyl ester carboxylesterase